KREQMTGHLRNPQTLQRSISRELQNCRVQELVASRHHYVACDASLRLNFNSSGTSASEVLPLARNQRRGDCQCNIGDRPNNLAPKKCPTHTELPAEGRIAGSHFSSGQPLGSQLVVCQG